MTTVCRAIVCFRFGRGIQICVRVNFVPMQPNAQHYANNKRLPANGNFNLQIALAIFVHYASKLRVIAMLKERLSDGLPHIVTAFSVCIAISFNKIAQTKAICSDGIMKLVCVN